MKAVVRIHAMLTPPRRVGARRRRETVAELLADVVEHDAFPKDRAPWVVEAVVGGLRALVPDDDRAVAAALPGDLRRIWEGTSLQLEPQAVSH